MSASVCIRHARSVAAVAARVRFLPAVLLSAVILAPALGADEATSVETFVQERDKWQRLQGVTLRIEGRWRIFNDDRLLLANCELPFVFDEGIKAPTSRGKNVEVTGQLETRQGRLLFRVTQLKVVPSDPETLALRRARLQTNDAQGWYELADWCAGRGRFYEDSALLEEAKDLRQTGILIEYRQVGVTEVEPLFALAAKVSRLKLPESLREQIVHDAVRRELQAARQKDAKAYDVALTHLLRELSGADQPLELDAETLELQERYQARPLEVYEQADSATRRRLHRLLYAGAALARIELDAAPDGRNGYAIAARIDRTLPEFAARAEEYRAREINSQMERLARLSREELLLLSSRLTERNDAARAADVRRRWLTAQEPSFRERGANGLFDMADEYVKLLDDREAAAAIYIDLFRQRTTQEAARSRLVQLGYRFDGTNWTPGDETQPDRISDAIRRGIVRRGMTAEQVRAALGGPAKTVVKFAAKDQVSELWVYAEHGISIQFTRRGKEGESIAVEINDLTGR